MQFSDFDQLIKKVEKNLGRARSTEKRKGIEDHIEGLKVSREIAQKQMLTERDVRRAMSVTCYENVGCCCGLEKPCLWRHSCRQALGIDDETYVEVRAAVIWEILECLNKKEH
jgi:predicted metal-binding transcription factor (methanogenesis marker protein 9)